MKLEEFFEVTRVIENRITKSTTYYHIIDLKYLEQEIEEIQTIISNNKDKDGSGMYVYDGSILAKIEARHALKEVGVEVRKNLQRFGESGSVPAYQVLPGFQAIRTSIELNKEKKDRIWFRLFTLIKIMLVSPIFLAIFYQITSNYGPPIEKTPVGAVMWLWDRMISYFQLLFNQPI